MEENEDEILSINKKNSVKCSLTYKPINVTLYLSEFTVNVISYELFISHSSY
jgi:hypothetical protein